jgi:hypothetical protein
MCIGLGTGREFVSILVALRRAKKLWVATTFGGVSMAADAAVGTAFFEFGAVWCCAACTSRLL